jgi:hypothetical protein
MTYSVRTLLLAAVVFMASRVTTSTVGGPGKGQAGPGLQVSRFVCATALKLTNFQVKGYF